MAAKKEAIQDNTTAKDWNEFHRRIEVSGDSGRRYSAEELNNWLADLSEEEVQMITDRLHSLRFESLYPRAVGSVLEDVFYIVDTARWHLKRDGESERMRMQLAFHMHRFAEALREACERARAIERGTGFSGRELISE